jgi:hypothetical protein
VKCIGGLRYRELKEKNSVRRLDRKEIKLNQYVEEKRGDQFVVNQISGME